MASPRHVTSVRPASALLLLLAALLAGCASPNTLRPFTTDGCSLYPDRSASTGKDWCACCVAHDRAYWRGGTEAERLKADEATQQAHQSLPVLAERSG